MTITNVGRLRATLGLDTSQFDKGVGRANASMNRLKVAAAAAIAGAAVALVRLTSGGLQFVDAQAKMARSIDGSIDGLRALQIVAGDAGVSGGTLSNALQKLSQRLAEAERRAGPSRDAIERLGLTVADFAGLDIDEKIALIADRTEKLGYSAAQTGDFLRDLGVRQQEVALLIGAGSEAIRAARKEVVDFGLSLNDVDAAKVEAANDAMSRVGRVMEGIGNQLAIAFAPALQSMAEGFTNLARVGGPINQIITTLGKNIGRIATYAAVAGGAVAVRFAGGLVVAAVSAVKLSSALVVLRGALIRTGIGALVVGVGEVIYQFNDLIKTTGSLGNLMILFGDLAKEVWDRFVMRLDIVKMRFEIFGLRIKQVWLEVISFLAEKFSGFAEKVAAPFNKLAETIGVDTRIDPFGLSEWSKGLAGSVSATEAEIAALKDSIASTDAEAGAPLQAFTDAVIRAREETESTVSAAERLAAALDPLSPAGETDDEDEPTPSAGGAGSGGGGVFDKIAAGAAAATDAVKDLAETAKSFAEQAGGAVGNALSGMLDGLLQGTFNARDALRQLANDLFKLASQAIFKQLLGGIGGGGGFVGGLVSAFGGARASGGPVNAGVPYLVGEKGPELVVPRTKSQVIPNHQIGGFGANGGSAENSPPDVNVNNIIVNDERRLGDYIQKGGGNRLVRNIVRMEMVSSRG